MREGEYVVLKRVIDDGQRQIDIVRHPIDTANTKRS